MRNLNEYRKLLSQLSNSLEYWAEGAVLDFTEELAQIMEANNVSQAELANRIGSSRAYVSKLLSGEENLTILTMTKVSMALDHCLRLHVAPLGTRTVWNDVGVEDTTDVADISILADRAVDVIRIDATSETHREYMATADG